MRVFTIGYEGASLKDFIPRLLAGGVSGVVDVRETPISRKKGFSKSTLAAALEQSGIAYRHMRELGCPKPVRDRYRQDGDWSRYTKAFLAHLARQEVALKELSALARREATAVLCFEADFNRCHRTYVARAVARNTGARVLHLISDGTAVADADFAALARSAAIVRSSRRSK